MEGSNTIKTQHFPHTAPKPASRTWRHPADLKIDRKRQPFMAKEFQSTRFDCFISSVGNVDPGSGSFRLYNDHLSNVERLHYTYFLTCTLLSGLFFAPILYWLFGAHTYRELLTSMVSNFFVEANAICPDLGISFGRWVSSIHEYLSEYLAWRMFAYATVLFIWLCATDTLRYALFVKAVGKLWHRKNWLRKPIQSAGMEKFLQAFAILRGKRKGRHVGLM